MKTLNQAFTQLLPGQAQQARIAFSVENIKQIAKVLALCVTIAATIYIFVSDNKLTAAQISDIFVASTKAIFQGSISLLDHLFVRFGNCLPSVLRKIGSWAAGELQPSRCVKLLFGENGKVFIACRLAAVLLLVT